jgi:ubiquinone/menaquinone biosynthesis C-methylase UbiE
VRDKSVRRIIRAYQDPVVRFYCWARFGILRQRFVDEIGQYLPPSGVILDIGCGFGLFSLYYASIAPRRSIRGIDVNGTRVAMARRAAELLAIENVSYAQSDARDVTGHAEYVGAYMLDIVHHVPKDSVEPLLRRLHEVLVPGARLLIKDVEARPALKRWFTWALDRLMNPRTPLHYWPAEELQGLLERVGFVVYRHSMVDILPYPHVLYICTRPIEAEVPPAPWGGWPSVGNRHGPARPSRQAAGRPSKPL